MRIAWKGGELPWTYYNENGIKPDPGKINKIISHCLQSRRSKEPTTLGWLV
jgi:hypothetical protein